MLRAYKFPNLPKQQQFIVTPFYGMMGGVSLNNKKNYLHNNNLTQRLICLYFRTIVYLSVYYNIALYSEINGTSCLKKKCQAKGLFRH
jgi:hypothetical protein